MRIEFAFYDGETRGTNAGESIEDLKKDIESMAISDGNFSIKRKDNQFTTILNGEINVNEIKNLTTEAATCALFRKMFKYSVRHIAKEWKERFNTMGWVTAFDIVYDIDDTQKVVKEIAAEIERHFDKVTNNKNAHFGICVNELTKDYSSNDAPHIVVSININAPTVEKQLLIDFYRVFKRTFEGFLKHRTDSFAPIINLK